MTGGLDDHVVTLVRAQKAEMIVTRVTNLRADLLLINSRRPPGAVRDEVARTLSLLGLALWMEGEQ